MWNHHLMNWKIFFSMVKQVRETNFPRIFQKVAKFTLFNLFVVRLLRLNLRLSQSGWCCCIHSLIQAHWYISEAEYAGLFYTFVRDKTFEVKNNNCHVRKLCKLRCLARVQADCMLLLYGNVYQEIIRFSLKSKVSLNKDFLEIH